MPELLRGENFLDFDGITRNDLMDLIDAAKDLKEKRLVGIRETPHEGKTLALLFEKPSLRTRVSFEVAMKELGGDVVYLGPEEVGLGKREVVEDVAMVLGRYVHGVVIRTFSHENLVKFATVCPVPVINALSDSHHPCQIAGDLLTMKERFAELEGRVVCFIGDGNNVANSWINVAPLAEIAVHVACPEGYEPDKYIYKNAVDAGANIRLFRNPLEAAKGADVLYTDVWTSMGQEAENEKRLQVFRPYRIDEKVLAVANKDAIIMHCLPAHYGQEISGKISRSPQSVIFDQAENRLHSTKAILQLLI